MDEQAIVSDWKYPNSSLFLHKLNSEKEERSSLPLSLFLIYNEAWSFNALNFIASLSWAPLSFAQLLTSEGIWKGQNPAARRLL